MFFSEKEELHQRGKDSNVVLGAFVTCYGRMVLYEELYKLDNRILCYDTDSIIFLSKHEACYEPQLGDYLGKLTSEVKIKDGNHIIEFDSAGPKNYAYNITVEQQEDLEEHNRLWTMNEEVNQEHLDNEVSVAKFEKAGMKGKQDRKKDRLLISEFLVNLNSLILASVSSSIPQDF